MTKPLHSLSPQELAVQGIPVEVALRARIKEAVEAVNGAVVVQDWVSWERWSLVERERRDSLAIIEAQR